MPGRLTEIEPRERVPRDEITGDPLPIPEVANSSMKAAKNAVTSVAPDPDGRLKSAQTPARNMTM